jgi:hypothetical protein
MDLTDSRTGFTYSWNGSHTVNVFDSWGKEIDVFTFGFNSEGIAPTWEEFSAAVARRIGE